MSGRGCVRVSEGFATSTIVQTVTNTESEAPFLLYLRTARALEVQAALHGGELHVERHELLPQNEEVLHLCLVVVKTGGRWGVNNTEEEGDWTGGVVGQGWGLKTLDAHNCGDGP